MPASAFANFLGLTSPDAGQVLVFVGAVATLLVLLYGGRALGRLRRQRSETRSAWERFHMLARTRGLTAEQAEAVAHLTTVGRVQRPSQVLASVRLLDRCLDRAREGLSDRQVLLLGQARERLVTTAQTRDPHRERRNVERVECRMSVGVVEVAREDLEQELPGHELADAGRVHSKLEELAAQARPEQGDVIDISAGGIALVVREDLPVEDKDYVGLRGTGQAAPVDLSGLWARVCGVEHRAEEGVTHLHLAFLPCDPEKKRAIIRLVYQLLDPGAPDASSAAPPAAVP